MCEPMTIAAVGAVTAGVATLAGTGVKVAGTIQGGKAEAQMLSNQATQASWAASDARRRGRDAAGRVREMGATASASSQAQISGGNVDTASGSAAGLLAGNEMMTELDAETTKANALREEWGLRNQARDLRASAHNKKKASFLSAIGQAFGGAGSAASSFASAGYYASQTPDPKPKP